MIENLKKIIDTTIEANSNEPNKWRTYAKCKKEIIKYQQEEENFDHKEYDKYIKYITTKLNI